MPDNPEYPDDDFVTTEDQRIADEQLIAESRQQQDFVQATVSVMTGGRKKTFSFMELRCPESMNIETGMLQDAPECNVPIKRIAKGRAEVAAFQEEFRVKTGDLIAATFDIRTPSNSTGGRRNMAAASSGDAVSLREGSFRVLNRMEQKEIYTGQAIELKAVVHLLDFCGWMNPFRSADNAYRTCSFGKTTFHPDNVAVVGPITVDCKGQLARGVLPPISFDGSRCGVAEMQYWVQAAEAQTAKMAESDPKLRAVLQSGPRRRIITVLPRETRCAFEGVADFSCMGGGKCRIFIDGEYARDVHLYFHELQHTHGLNHAYRGFREYGDETDPMGNTPGTSQGVHCNNAPNNFRMGWHTFVPGGDLHAANFGVGRNNRLTFNIPASGASDQNMVIIDLGTKPGGAAAPIPYPKFFLSYRVAESTFGGYDGALKASYHQKVVIHNYNGSVNDRDSAITNYIDAGPRFSSPADSAAFPDGNVWTAPFVPFNADSNFGGGFRVRVVSTGASSATVEVCRMYSETEGVRGSAECRANMDRDW
ncbi:hypothetical protein PLESTF_001192600 [Pleodorina starrii]|nr:hypothetical protein PLESTF_001192600 [Pleodorina starrii]